MINTFGAILAFIAEVPVLGMPVNN